MSLKIILQGYKEHLGVEDINKWFVEKYTDELCSIRDLMKLLDTKSNRSVMKILRYLNIDVRQGGEAVATQWINNPQRRNETSERAVVNLNNPRSRAKLYEVMQTEEYKEKMSKANGGENNGMYGVVGEDHPQWNPDRTHDQRVKERKLGIDKKWRESVYERDDYSCVRCGYGRELNAHHIFNYHKYVRLRHSVINGATLCTECHRKFHNEYGNKDNTAYQFIAFMKEKE